MFIIIAKNTIETNTDNMFACEKNTDKKFDCKNNI